MEALSKIKEISNRTFYEMENFSQFIIDIVEEVEEADLTDSETRGALLYDIENALEIINPERVEDVKTLMELRQALRTNPKETV